MPARNKHQRFPRRKYEKRQMPLVAVTVLTAHVNGLLPVVTVYSPIRPQLEVSPDQAHLFLDTGPVVDVRATSAVTSYLSGRLREDSWIITVVAFDAHVAYDSLDEAVEKLRTDIHVGDIGVGTHVGLPWTPARFQLPIEAILKRYHDEVLRDLETGDR